MVLIPECGRMIHYVLLRMQAAKNKTRRERNLELAMIGKRDREKTEKRESEKGKSPLLLLLLLPNLLKNPQETSQEIEHKLSVLVCVYLRCTQLSRPTRTLLVRFWQNTLYRHSQRRPLPSAFLSTWTRERSRVLEPKLAIYIEHPVPTTDKPQQYRRCQHRGSSHPNRWSVRLLFHSCLGRPSPPSSLATLTQAPQASLHSAPLPAQKEGKKRDSPQLILLAFGACNCSPLSPVGWQFRKQRNELGLTVSTTSVIPMRIPIYIQPDFHALGPATKRMLI